MDYLRRNALNETRIFRDKPDDEEYNEFLQLLEGGHINELQHDNNNQYINPIVVSWFIRMFLFHLPIPLITNQYEISKRLLNAIDVKLPIIFVQNAINDNELNDNQNEDGILDELLYIKSLIMSLKTEHFHILRSVICLFHEICLNQMEDHYESLDAHHLAQIFGPIMIGLNITSNSGKLKSEDSRTLDLSQDLVLFLINHYQDIFERNSFKELIHIHQTNKNMQVIQLQQQETIKELEKQSAVYTEKLYKSHFESKLRSRSFLAWKDNVPRFKSQRKQYTKLQELRNELISKNKIIQKQSKQIRSLQTKLELNEFDNTISSHHPTIDNVIGGHSKDAQEDAVNDYLRKSIAEIANIQQFDRRITKDSSYKTLLL